MVVLRKNGAPNALYIPVADCPGTAHRLCLRPVWRWQNGHPRRVWNVLQPAGWQSGVHQFRTVAARLPGVGQQCEPLPNRGAKYGRPTQSVESEHRSQQSLHLAALQGAMGHHHERQPRPAAKLRPQHRGQYRDQVGPQLRPAPDLQPQLDSHRNGLAVHTIEHKPNHGGEYERRHWLHIRAHRFIRGTAE